MILGDFNTKLGTRNKRKQRNSDKRGKANYKTSR